jgi:hypothetical protein
MTLAALGRLVGSARLRRSQHVATMISDAAMRRAPRRRAANKGSANRDSEGKMHRFGEPSSCPSPWALNSISPGTDVVSTAPTGGSRPVTMRRGRRIVGGRLEPVAVERDPSSSDCANARLRTRRARRASGPTLAGEAMHGPGGIVRL